MDGIEEQYLASKTTSIVVEDILYSVDTIIKSILFLACKSS